MKDNSDENDDQSNKKQKDESNDEKEKQETKDIENNKDSYNSDSESSSSSFKNSMSSNSNNENKENSNSNSESQESSDNEEIENENENENENSEENKDKKDIKKYEKEVKDKSFHYEEIKSLNEDGKFLMEHNINDSNTKEQIKNIINNFPNSESIINKYIKEFSEKNKEDFFKENGFILTNKSKERMAYLIHYILSGNPVLFEGNTGTAKTRTTLVACQYIKKFINEKYEFVRFNLCAETRIDDLISKYVGDRKSLIGLKVENSQFLDAYINGKILLLDEINLASAKVLQCIQQSLDNGYISVETSGRGLIKYMKHENFSLVATQNPNKDAYLGKRQELTPEFLSRFQKIYCEEIEINEMKEISFGIAKNLGYINDKNESEFKEKRELIYDIVQLHYEWSKQNESKNDVKCFTIREIETVIEALKENNNIYDTLMTVYGGRYPKEKKNDLILKFKNFNSLANLQPSANELPKDFPKCFSNIHLIEATKSILLSLNNKRNVLIVGKNESGLTQLAKWCSFFFNESKNQKKTYICFCTKNLERSDLIGSQKLSSSKKYTTEILKFKKGILYKAIKDGFSIVLDSINEAPSRVIERLNELLDKKIKDNEKIIEVPENPNDPILEINDNFRIISTSNYEKLNQMSPAFINRFEIVYLDDQLVNLNEDKFKELINFEFNYFHSELYYNIKYKNEIDEEIKKKEKNLKNKEKKENSKIKEDINPF